jgi:hypothetical protein
VIIRKMFGYLSFLCLNLIHIESPCKNFLHCQSIITVRLYKMFDFDHNYL